MGKNDSVMDAIAEAVAACVATSIVEKKENKFDDFDWREWCNYGEKYGIYAKDYPNEKSFDVDFRHAVLKERSQIIREEKKLKKELLKEQKAKEKLEKKQQKAANKNPRI
ncbi:MAG: hypothetical protein R3Y27_01665 [Clostridia bacterium]